MAGLAPVELTADCSACGLESGVVEVYDALVAACRFGLPATTRCKLCAAATAGAFDRTPSRPLREIPANRCPACLHELTPSAVDDRACPTCSARAFLEETSPPLDFSTLADLERALDLWAEREKFPSRDALLKATFVHADVAEIFAVLQRKERLEVLADPFANMGVRTTGGSARDGAGAQPSAGAKSTSPETPHAIARAKPTIDESTPMPDVGLTSVPSSVPLAAARPEPTDAQAAVDSATRARPGQSASPSPVTQTARDIAYAPTEPLAAPLLPPRESRPPPPSAPPRAIVYPLVSVIVADGEVHPEELALVDRFLQSEGLAPLSPEELRVHHPSEVAHFVPKERREAVVQLMCESAAVDGMPDESERRVIRAYATAWDVDDEKIDFWMWGYEEMNTSLARQLFLKLRRFVLSARWSDAERG